MSTERYTAAEVVAAVRKTGGVVVDAAKVLGCAASTVYNYARRYATVRKAIEETRRSTYAEAHSRLLEILRDKDHKDHKWAIDRVLRTYSEHVPDGLEWSDKARLSHRREERGEIVVNFVPNDGRGANG